MNSYVEVWGPGGRELRALDAVVPLRTVPGRADGIAQATNASGLTVGYLGNQTDTEPERGRP